MTFLQTLLCGSTFPNIVPDPNSYCGKAMFGDTSLPIYKVAAPGVPEGALTQPYQPTSQAVQQSQDVVVAQTQENMQAYVNSLPGGEPSTSIFQSSWIPWIAVGVVAILLWRK